MNVTIHGYNITCTPEEFNALVKSSAPTTAPTIAEPPPVHVPRFTAPQTPAPAPHQPGLFVTKERTRKGVFGTLPQFAGLAEPRAKSAMFRLFQIVSSAYPRAVLKSSARDSLCWAKETAWEYACALEDAGLIERCGDSFRAKTNDIPFAEATIAEFAFLRDKNCHHYIRVKDRA